MQNNKNITLTQDTHSSILDELQSDQLPVLPPGAPFLLKTLSNENISMKDLAGIIERFPNIAARLITLSNSAWSSPASAISSLDVACARLGFSIVRSVSIALAVSSPFNANHCPAFDPVRYWCSSIMVADASSWLASVIPQQIKLDVATARAAGLLHNLGLLWLTDKLPREMQKVFMHLQHEPEMHLNQTLYDTLGIFCHSASGRLAQHWCLPEILVIAMSEQSNEVYADRHWELTAVVGEAVNMVSSLFHNVPWPEDTQRLSRLSVQRNIANDLFERLSTQFARTHELAQTLFKS